MSVNIGVFTFIVMCFFVWNGIYCFKISKTSPDSFVGISIAGCIFSWILVFSFLIATLFALSNDKCMVNLGNIVKISGPSDSDRKIQELEIKYNRLLETKFNETK